MKKKRYEILLVRPTLFATIVEILVPGAVIWQLYINDEVKNDGEGSIYDKTN